MGTGALWTRGRITHRGGRTYPHRVATRPKGHLASLWVMPMDATTTTLRREIDRVTAIVREYRGLDGVGAAGDVDEPLHIRPDAPYRSACGRELLRPGTHRWLGPTLRDNPRALAAPDLCPDCAPDARARLLP